MFQKKGSRDEAVGISRGFAARDEPPTQAFLGELVFHPSRQTPAQPKTTFLSQAKPGMLSSVKQAFVGRDPKRAPLKTPAWEATLVTATIDYITTALPPNLTRLLHNTASYAGYGPQRPEISTNCLCI